MSHAARTLVCFQTLVEDSQIVVLC